MGKWVHLHEDEPDHAGRCGRNTDSLVLGRYQTDVDVRMQLTISDHSISPGRESLIAVAGK